MTTPTHKALHLAEQLAGMTSRYPTPSYERGVLNGAVQELRRLAALSSELSQQADAREHRLQYEAGAEQAIAGPCLRVNGRVPESLGRGSSRLPPLTGCASGAADRNSVRAPVCKHSAISPARRPQPGSIQAAGTGCRARTWDRREAMTHQAIKDALEAMLQAEGKNDGEWTSELGDVNEWGTQCWEIHGEIVQELATAYGEATAAYIAACNPTAISALLAELEEAKRDVASKQAQIDRLMLEYCPDEMTPEQLEEWARHQVAVANPPSLAALRESLKGVPDVSGAAINKDTK